MASETVTVLHKGFAPITPTAATTAAVEVAPSVTFSPVADFAALGTRWRNLETRAQASFFQSWTWVGCLARNRYPDPMLLCAQIAGPDGPRDVALALFNRQTTRFAPQTLYLSETGQAAFDAMYVEHSGFLIAAGYEYLLDACLRAVTGDRVILSGVDANMLRAAQHSGRELRVLQSMPSPFIDLTRLPPGEQAYLAQLSANTRYQLRRSTRLYEAQGALCVTRATTVAQANAMLDELGELHQATWEARGLPGAFANPMFRRFHRELIARGLPRGEIELLRVSAGAAQIGCLYNFRFQNQVMNYQGGFAYERASPHQKPGLTTHHQAIELARAEGTLRYDFLAGEDRYKTSLANDQMLLHWLDLVPRWSRRGIATRLLRWMRPDKWRVT